MEDHLHKAKSLALALRGAGKRTNEDDFFICLLRRLGYEFDPIVAAINARDNFPPFEAIISN